MAEIGESAWVDVEVSEVRRSDGDDPSSRVHVVILKERSGVRGLPIFVGAPEVLALACSLESVETPRPMTYQFAADLARAGGSTVSEVRVTKLSERMFYAVAVLEGPRGISEVDSRPERRLAKDAANARIKKQKGAGGYGGETGNGQQADDYEEGDPRDEPSETVPVRRTVAVRTRLAGSASVTARDAP